MKTIVPLICLLLSGIFPAPGTALPGPVMCASWYVGVWPSSGTVLPDQEFMFEGYMDAQPLARSFSKKCPAYLYSDAGKVALEVVAVNEGGFRLTQALFRPKTPLKPGLTYRLAYHNGKAMDTLTDYSYALDSVLPVEWTVASASVGLPDPLPAAPVEIEKSYKGYGCGPAVYVDFGVEVPAGMAWRVKAEVRKVGTGIRTTYCLPVVEGRFSIGHGMCSGAFDLEERADYEARFALVDGEGNEMAWKGQVVGFQAPGPEGW